MFEPSCCLHYELFTLLFVLACFVTGCMRQEGVMAFAMERALGGLEVGDDAL
jgi:hypothetical protein